ncbi:hypothetical protein MDMS009_2224 [Methylophaga thiooxydans DMS010]|uniref:Uncharacterized protein n=1 Tax=Methylophaga thiooxydans DMS010 TaxID=637616 RepID=C0N7M8_9GAMM|nr:hypothetical protein MDMS009_2224 [Methylophaga thiooxydans DMS010]
MFIENNKAGIDCPTFPKHIYLVGVGVSADIVIGFKNGYIVLLG